MPSPTLPQDLESLLTTPGTFISKRGDRKYKILVSKERDIFGEGLSFDPAGEREKRFIISIQKPTTTDTEIPYIAAMLTGFGIDSRGRVVLNFLSVFKYNKLYRHILQYLDRQAEASTPILDDLEYYLKNGLSQSHTHYDQHLASVFKRPELLDQLHFLVRHLKHHSTKRGATLSNQEFEQYMTSKTATYREFSGLAIELIHYIFDQFPKGTVIKFELAHIKTDQSMLAGRKWSDTNFGKVVLRETGTQIYKIERVNAYYHIDLVKK